MMNSAIRDLGFRLLATATALSGLAVAHGQPAATAPAMVPTELPGLVYTNEYFPGAAYRAEVPSQAAVLGFSSGERATSAAEVERCLRAWTNAAPDRTRLVEYARSYEGRPLYYMVVTSPTNLAQLDRIQGDLARLGDPRTLPEGEARELIEKLPAVGWLAYTIHGDETEGSDAALALLYHLVAAQNPEVTRLLEAVVVIVDPLMNPDGRDRFVKMVAEHRGAMPNVDDQSLVHEGYWPYGRGNHYLFDLNRDWILGVHPETRGRIREVARWNPQLFVDAHGMGAQDTHLFSPPREPINPNIPAGRADWGRRFARDQAQAMDRLPFLYYTGEWHEEWYPGYSDGWASYRGAVGILYEQARVAEDGVRRPGGRVLSYRESVHHHVVGSMANLLTLERNGRDLRQHLYDVRKAALEAQGPYGRRTFALLPTANRGRLTALVDLLRLQGIDVFVATNDSQVALATDQLGREWKDRVVPAGTLLVPNRQPLGNLVAAMLEFDPRLKPEVLLDERQELLKKGRSRIYDTTAWNLTMLYGLEAWTLPTDLPPWASPYVPVSTLPLLPAAEPEFVAWVIDGADDRSVAAAARLSERGVEVRVSDKPFRLDNREFARGSVVVTRLDNRHVPADWRAALSRTAGELGLEAIGIRTGLGEGELPDLGGRHFRRIEPPRIGLLTRGRFSTGDYGSIWHALDHHLGIRHSHLDETSPGDLSRYNVLIVPETWGGLSAGLVDGLKDWTRQGGTLVVVAGSANPLITAKAEFSRVRPLAEVFDKLPEYELTILREWLGRTGGLPPAERVWAHTASTALEYPWQAIEGGSPDEKELKKRDAWQSLFMPQGAFLASRVDTNHWLTVGCGEWLPVLADPQPILMAADGVEAPLRYGYLVPAVTRTNVAEATPKPEAAGANPKDDAARKEGEKKDRKDAPRVGWCALPPGTEMHLRMSGLLWPEAAHRLANAACVTRESYGRGQIILFATPPTFRGGARGTTRLFLNAVAYGPAWGASQPVRP